MGFAHTGATLASMVDISLPDTMLGPHNILV